MKVTTTRTVTRRIPRPGRRLDGRFLGGDNKWERVVHRVNPDTGGVEDITEVREMRWLLSEEES